MVVIKYFAVSDLHGSYSKLRKALDDVSFEVKNKNHKLIVVGDSFDRGREIKQVYNFLKLLHENEQLIYVKGNHELMLEQLGDVLKWKDKIEFNVAYNGFGKTIKSLYGKHDSVEELLAVEEKFNNDDFIKVLVEAPLYFETTDYVFLHAGINDSKINQEWRELIDEKDLWTNTKHFMSLDLRPAFGCKKVVCGHYQTWRLRESDVQDKASYEIYYSKDELKVGIDGGAYLPLGKVNVFIFNE